MRELLLKNMLSKDKKRSELFLSEHFEKDGVIQEIEKKTVYKVRDILEFTIPADLDKFLDQKRKEDAGVQRYIIKSRSQKTGMRKFIYKVVGEQYVVLKDRIFVLRVSQSLKKIVIDKSKSEQPTGAES